MPEFFVQCEAEEEVSYVQRRCVGGVGEGEGGVVGLGWYSTVVAVAWQKRRCVFSFSARAESNFSRSFRMMYSSSLHSVLRALGQKAKDFFSAAAAQKLFFLVRPLNGEV